MTNILIIEDSSDMGGVQHSTLNFSKYLKTVSDVNFFVLVPGKGQLIDELKLHDIHVIKIDEYTRMSTGVSFFNDKFRILNPFAFVYNYFQSARFFKDCKYKLNQHVSKIDVVLTKGLHSHVLGSKIARIYNAKTVWYCQDFITNRYFGLNRWIFSQLVNRYASVLVADGQSIIDSFKLKGKVKSKVLYNGVNTDNFMFNIDELINFRKLYNIAESDFVFGNIARIVPWKGQEILIDSFKLLTQEKLNIKLVIVGGPLFGSEKYFQFLKNKVVALGIEDKVIFTGQIASVDKIYSLFNAFIYPTQEMDTCPISLVGAFAAGLPVSASKVEGVFDVFGSAPESIYFDPKNAIEICNSMETILQNFKDRPRVKENIEFCKTNFENDVISQRMLQMILNSTQKS